MGRGPGRGPGVRVSAGRLPYCRICEPAVLLLGRVGAAFGNRPDRRAGGRWSSGDTQWWGAAVRGRRRRVESCCAGGPGRRGGVAGRDQPYRRGHAVSAHRCGRASGADRGRVDPWCGEDGAGSLAPRPARVAGMDAGGRRTGVRPLSARFGSARPGHPFTARVRPHADRHRPDSDRYSWRSSGPADQRSSPPISPGRERWGTPIGSRGVVGLAERLRAAPEPAGLRPAVAGCEIGAGVCDGG